MKLRYAGTCCVCTTELAARTEAIYERSTKTVRCLGCPTFDQPEAADGRTVESRDVVYDGPSLSVAS